MAQVIMDGIKGRRYSPPSNTIQPLGELSNLNKRRQTPQRLYIHTECCYSQREKEQKKGRLKVFILKSIYFYEAMISCPVNWDCFKLYT